MTRHALATLVLMALIFACPSAATAEPESCGVTATGGGSSVMIGGMCSGLTSGNSTSDFSQAPNAPVTKTMLCGWPSSQDNGFWDVRCGSPRKCPTGPAYATFVQQNRQWVLLDSWCPGQAADAAPPVPTAADLRQQVLRLLPSVQIGSAWTTRALVNAESIFWAQTRANRNLGTVTVVGRQVALKIDFDHADWDFGDATTDTTDQPGRPYDDANPCSTAQCPDYYGHTYRDTGPVTITLTIAWHAQFSLDNGTTWTDVDPAPLTGPSATHQLTVVQARGILVHDP